MRGFDQFAVLVALAMAATSLCAGGQAVAQPVAFAIADAWQDTSLSVGDCVQRSAAAMDAAGFTVFQSSAEEARASKGNFTAIARCLNGKGVVFFIVIGPSEQNGKFLETIAAKFSGP